MAAAVVAVVGSVEASLVGSCCREVCLRRSVAHASPGVVEAGVARNGACGLRCGRCRNCPGTRCRKTSTTRGRCLGLRTAAAEESDAAAAEDAAADDEAVAAVVDATAAVVADHGDGGGDAVVVAAAAVAGDDGDAPQQLPESV